MSDRGENVFNQPLPMAVDGPDGFAAARAAIGAVELHIESLERQMSFFTLRDYLSARFADVSEFYFNTGSHYNDEGYSDHVNLTVRLETSVPGQFAEYESDEEYGSFVGPDGVDVERFDQLSDFISGLPDCVYTALSDEWIDATSERALAQAVMGAEGFAAYEAATLRKAVAPAEPSSNGSTRI